MTRIIALLAVGLCLAASAGAGETPELKTLLDKASYAIGTNIGRSMASQGLELNVEALARGLRDAIEGRDLALTSDEMHKALAGLQMEVRKKQQALSKENLAKGEAFLAENEKKEGVATTDSGLQYKILTPGAGKKPEATDKVTVHYRGTLIDGTEFDSSIGKDPVTFGVKGVIPGWTEALQLMQTGAKWQLFIPADLAYGPQGRPGIPPNSVLVFEVELLKVN
jgi:FKBP-type peptidyl-prolyl cis-trans isomerase